VTAPPVAEPTHAPTTGPASGTARRLLGESVGTGLLVCVVAGSGIAAQRLSPAQPGLELLQNSIATTLGLAVLILVLAPVSGAHLNPLVSVADWLLSRRPARSGPGDGPTGRRVAAYAAAQSLGAIAGAILANVMFDLPAVQLATTDRLTGGHLIAEVVATAGLVTVVFGLVRTDRPAWLPPAVAAWIGAAYWFTSSTSFANPAVTLGRTLTDTFTGIAPASALAFAAAQTLGAALGVGLVLALYPVPPVRPAATSIIDPSGNGHPS
jgi:glycerol uptake facilitator-like aquaporin